MRTSLLEDLPSELLLHLLSFLPLPSLLSLSSTCRSFHSLIESTVLPDYAVHRLNYSPVTLSHLHSSNPRRWRWGRKAMWAERVGLRWRDWDFTGVGFGAWDKCMPVLRLWSVGAGISGVLIARGTGIEWWVAIDERGTMDRVEVVVQGFDGPPGVHKKKRSAALDEITALAEGARAGEVVVSRVSGVVQRLKVIDRGGSGRPIVLQETTRYAVPHADRARPGSTAVQALDSRSGIVVSASTTRLRPPRLRDVAPFDENDSLAHTLMKRSAPKLHQVSIHSISSPWQPPSVIPLASKPWSVQLEPSSSTPTWLAIGQSGTTPLTLSLLDSTGTPVPSSQTSLASTAKPTSVYSMTTPSLDCSPFLRPDQTLIAAFFDSTTRIYDLRVRPAGPSSCRVVSNWDDSPSSSSNEVLRLCDPWSDDPSYSVSSGGPHGAYVAVGSARNSAVRLFDIRSVARGGGRGKSGVRGITAFGVHGDRSPVYGVRVEHSRVWAVTERSATVFNFHADASRGDREVGVAFVGHEGEGKGELRRTSRKNRVVEL
ncbi:hypothetical protein JCM11491_005286 [Sporobolomyces phaffii]